MTALSVDGEPLPFIVQRQLVNVRTGLQRLFGRIGDETAGGVGDKDAVEGLICRDHARLCGWACVLSIHIHDQAVEGVVAMSDDLPEAEPGCVNLGHAALDTRRKLKRMHRDLFIFATE